MSRNSLLLTEFEGADLNSSALDEIPEVYDQREMRIRSEHFLNIKYDGARFSGGRLPLDVLADLQALEDILTTFAREIWLEANDRQRMPNGYADWFRISLTGVRDGSALPTLELSVQEDQQPLLPDGSRQTLMRQAEEKFAETLRAANDDRAVALSPTQIRNFNRFLTNLKPGELFKYSPEPNDTEVNSENVISIDVEKRIGLLTRVTSFYEQRVQGYARLKSVDEKGNLRFASPTLKEFPAVDNSRKVGEYGLNVGAYYEFDLTVERRHDDRVQSVITITICHFQRILLSKQLMRWKPSMKDGLRVMVVRFRCMCEKGQKNFCTPATTFQNSMQWRRPRKVEFCSNTKLADGTMGLNFTQIAP